MIKHRLHLLLITTNGFGRDGFAVIICVVCISQQTCNHQVREFPGKCHVGQLLPWSFFNHATVRMGLLVSLSRLAGLQVMMTARRSCDTRGCVRKLSLSMLCKDIMKFFLSAAGWQLVASKYGSSNRILAWRDVIDKAVTTQYVFDSSFFIGRNMCP